MATSFVENVNLLASKVDVVEEANSLFDENVIPVLEEIADLDLDAAIEDLLKGNYLGNRKIDINLALNVQGITEELLLTDPEQAEAIWTDKTKTVQYDRAVITFTDGEVITLPFIFDNVPVTVSTHGDLLAQLSRLDYINAVAQVDSINDVIVSNDTEYVITVDNVECKFTSPASATTKAIILVGLASAVNNNIFSVNATVVGGGSKLNLVATVPGTAFFASVSPNLLLTNTTPNVVEGPKETAFLAKLTGTLAANFAAPVVGEFVRLYDVTGQNSNIERITLHAVSGSYKEENSLYYWAKTTSAFQTLSMRANDIIKLGNEIDNIIKLALSIGEVIEIQNRLPQLVDTFSPEGVPNGDVTIYNNLDKLIAIHTKLNEIVTVYQDIKDNGPKHIEAVALNLKGENTIGIVATDLQKVDSNVKLVGQQIANVTAVGQNIDKVVTVSAFTNEISEVALAVVPNIAEVLQADSNAQIATNKALEATTAAATAVAKSNEIKNVSVGSTITGAAGTNASVVYNPANGKFTFVVPQGAKGDRGEAFSVNSIGTLAQRVLYNNYMTGYSFLAVDVDVAGSIIPHIYFKKSNASGDWTEGVPFGRGEKGDTGDAGNGIAQIAFTSTTHASGLSAQSGGDDEYTITYTDGTTDTFTVHNGIDSDISLADLEAHKNNITNPHNVTKAQIGLGNVNNTSDLDKPVSNPTKVYVENLMKNVAVINKPVIVTPANLTIDFLGPIKSTYSPSTNYEGLQTKALWECALDIDFTNIIDSYEGSDNLTSWSPVIGLPLTKVYVRTKQVSDSHRSEYSNVISFTTPDIYVTAPTLTVEGSPSSVTLTPILSGSAFNAFNGTDTHLSSDWRILKASDNSVVWESLNDTVNLLSIVPSQLPKNTDLIFMVRYNGAVYGSSDWSEVTAKTLNIYVKNPTLVVAGSPASVTLTPLLTGSTFEIVNGTDTHISSDWRVVRSANGTVVWESLGDTVNLTSISTAQLPKNTNLVFKVRYNSSIYGSSNWVEVNAKTLDIYVQDPVLTVAGAPNSLTLSPALSTSAFVVVNGTASHVSSDWEIRKVSDNSLVWSSIGNTTSKTSITPSGLQTTTQYKIRVKHNSNLYGSSNWVEVTGTTLNIYVENPTITVTGTPNGVPKNPTISGSAFSVMNGTDTHESTDYQAIRVSDGVVVWESLNNTVNKTSIRTGDLVESTAYIFKMRYKGTTYGYSQWVQVTGTTKAVFSVAYGVEWNPATDTYTRTGEASGTAVGTSYAGLIQTQMKRCVLNANGTVKYFLHPNDSTKKADGSTAIIDGTDGNVMVEIPKFWYKYEFADGKHKWLISDGEQPGFEIHPAFDREGTIRDFRYYPAYQGFTLSGKLISGSGRVPTASKTRAAFRTEAAANGAGWSQIDWNLLIAVQLLYLTEYADFDTQSMLGQGITSGGVYTAVTGSSNSLGNASSPSTNTNTQFMSYRGIENWYGQIFKFIDGVNVKEREYFVNKKPSTYADNVFTVDYATTGMTMVSSSGYVKNIVQSKNGFISSDATGTDSTYIPDYQYQSSGNRIIFFGGAAGGGLSAGGFCVGGNNAASLADASFGSAVSY